jgi:hypothetical protein
MPSCVAFNVLASWRANSLKVTADISWAMRSRALRGGMKYTLPSKTWVLWLVGQ